MSLTEIKENVYWVGAVDWDIRDFHGYSTYKGTTYNAYLIMDEKIALFDTVKKGFQEDLLYHISELTDPTKIDYIIVNHVEMDHSGCLPAIIDLVKPEKVFCSPMGHKALLDHFHRPDWPYEVVKSGDVVSLGKKTITFLETRMLHWPDNMFSYIKEDGLLISSDAFGQHLATTARYADEVEEGIVLTHAAKYFANIILLYSSQVLKLLETVAGMNIEINMIAPDHGLIWRNPEKILAAYESWSRQETKEKALIIFDSMWHSTEKMARAICGGLVKAGISTNLLNLKTNHRSDIMTEVLDARALVFGSPTLNNGLLPKMADFLSYLKGLRPQNKIGAAFGSYGWSGEAVKKLNEAMEEMKIQAIDPGIRVKNVPTAEDFAKCKDLGARLAEAIKQHTL